MSKLLDVALVAVAGGALVLGSFQAGKLQERSWWRHELASRNQEVKAAMVKLGRDADELDQTVLRIVEGERARLEDAESQIAKLNKRPAPQPELDGLCRPVAAACLQRGGSDNRAQANITPARRP